MLPGLLSPGGIRPACGLTSGFGSGSAVNWLFLSQQLYPPCQRITPSCPPCCHRCAGSRVSSQCSVSFRESLLAHGAAHRRWQEPHPPQPLAGGHISAQHDIGDKQEQVPRLPHSSAEESTPGGMLSHARVSPAPPGAEAGGPQVRSQPPQLTMLLSQNSKQKRAWDIAQGWCLSNKQEILCPIFTAT